MADVPLLSGEEEVAFNPNGLTSAEADARLKKYGPNELTEEEKNACIEFLKFFWGPMPIMIWLAILVELIQMDWPDFAVLLTLQIVNGTVGWHENQKAGDAIAALKSSLAPMADVKRDGAWVRIQGRLIVPGDIVKLTLGGAVPSDCKCLPGKPVQIDQSAMTGESMPVTMREGEVAKMGSNVVAGEVEALTVATGANTVFGKTAAMIAGVDEEGHFQKIIWSITLFLMGISLILVAFIMAVMLLSGNGFLETLSICVVLLVASIPIAMQVVCTSTMALGSHELAKQNAIVSRLAAIEELAGMDMLCSDKTGTLTLNKMTLQEKIAMGKDMTEDKLLLHALLGTQWTETAKDAIDTMLFVHKERYMPQLSEYEQLDYEPFDPSVKRTTSHVCSAKDKSKKMSVTKGAHHVVVNLCHNAGELHDPVDKVVNTYAERGIRCLAVASTDSEGKWCFDGVLTFEDPPRPDTKEVIERANGLGVAVKMITGDHVIIAKEVCNKLGMGHNVLTTSDLPVDDDTGKGQFKGPKLAQLGEICEQCDGFAQVFPEHKFLIVDILRQRGWVTGMTGDGVNDAPALKRADIGIAVQGATDAARAAADIVLCTEGLSVIILAIDLSRRIFQRMKNYVTYRIACTLQLLLFFFLAVLFVKPEDIMSPVGSEVIPPYFSLPVMALVLITILNDGTIISIAYDYVIPGATPEKWHLPTVIVVAILLGGVACASSMLALFMALNSGEPGHFYDRHFGVGTLTYEQVCCLMYLKISLSDFLTVFSARTHGPFFSRRPGRLLMCAACVAMGISTILAHTWPFPEMKGISWSWCGVMWGYCVLWWFLQDISKTLLYEGMKYTQDQKVAVDKTYKRRQTTMLAIAEEKKARGQTIHEETVEKKMSPTQIIEHIEALEAELKTLRVAAQKYMK